MLKRLISLHLMRRAVPVLVPAIVLLMLTLQLHVDVLNAPEPQIRISAGSEPDWETSYSFRHVNFCYLVFWDNCPEPNLLTVEAGRIADAVLSRHRGEWTISTHLADGLESGRLTLPDGEERLVWRYAMDGALIDIDALTGQPLLLVDGVWGRYTWGVCRKEVCVEDRCMWEVGPHSSSERCLDEAFKIQPYTLLILYLGVVGIVILVKEWRAGRLRQKKKAIP